MKLALEAANTIILDNHEIQYYRNYGYLVIPNLIKSELIQKIKSEISYITTLSHGQGKSKLIQSSQYLESMALNDLVNSAILKSITEQLLGGDSMIYMPFTAVKSANGGGQFHFHQDNQYTHLNKPALNCWIAFSDMTPENGCLCVVPESHKNGVYEYEFSPDGDSHRFTKSSIDKHVPIRMHAGDAIFFDRYTVHGSGKNTTDQNRIAYAIQFCQLGTIGKRPNEPERDIEKNPYYHVGPVAKLNIKEGEGEDKY